MVNKLLSFLNKDVLGLHSAAYILGGFAFLSQILGLIRDRIFAHVFGASSMLDIYYASFRIPDLVFVTVASIVSVSVLIPFLADRIDNREKVKDFLSNVFSVFFVFVVIVSIILFFFIPSLSSYIFPGFSLEEQNILNTLTRILLLSPILLGISNLFGSVTQIKQKFLLYAVSPVLYNFGIIVGIIALYPIFGIKGLAFGVVLGAFLHMIISVPFLISNGYMPRISFNINWNEIKKVVFLSLPRTVALSAHQISFIALLSIASVIGEGAITVFNFSWNIQSVPLAIIGISYSVAAFPTLAQLYLGGEQKEFCKQIMVAARHIIFWSLPAMVLFIVLRAQIVRVILGSGEFGWTETRLTAATLALFVVSLLCQSLVLLFVRGYYASGNTHRPFMINVFSSILVIVFGFVLINLFNSSLVFKYFMEVLFKIEGISGTSVIMLPLSYTLGLIVNCLIFWFLFQKDFSKFSKILSATFFQSLSASVVMGFAVHRFLKVFDNVFDINTLVGIFLQGFVSGILGILIGIVVLKLLKNTEIDEAIKVLHHRFWKAKAIGVEQREL